MTIIEIIGIFNNPTSALFAFDVLDELLDEDWTVREMFEYFEKWREPRSYEAIQQMFDLFLKEGLVVIRDTALMTNKEGNRETWNWYSITIKGRELYKHLLNKLYPSSSNSSQLK